MNKMVKKLLPFFLILLNIINLPAMRHSNRHTEQDEEKEKRKTLRYLTRLIQEGNTDNVESILSTGTNSTLTNEIELSIIKTISNNNLVYIIYLYSTLSEVMQQIERGTRIVRFHEIKATLEKYKQMGYNLSPEIVKIILTSEREEEKKQTSFHWYLNTKIIEKNRILNPCFKECLNWFYNKIIQFILKENLEGVIEILKKIPFIITIKREGLVPIGLNLTSLSISDLSSSNLSRSDLDRPFSSLTELSLTELIKQSFSEEKANYLLAIIENIKRRFTGIEPSAATAIFRYKIFT